MAFIPIPRRGRPSFLQSALDQVSQGISGFGEAGAELGRQDQRGIDNERLAKADQRAETATQIAQGQEGRRQSQFELEESERIATEGARTSFGESSQALQKSMSGPVRDFQQIKEARQTNYDAEARLMNRLNPNSMATGQSLRKSADEKRISGEEAFAAQEAKTALGTRKTEADIGLTKARTGLTRKQTQLAGTKAAGGPNLRGLPAGNAEKLAGNVVALRMLDGVTGKAKETGFGKNPFIEKLRVSEGNPFRIYDENAAIFAQYVATIKQVIGKGLEGGVLRKEDESKYEKIIPKAGDTSSIMDKKQETLKSLLVTKHTGELEGFAAADFDVSKFERFADKKKPDDPGNIDQSDPRVKEALAAGYSLEEIQEFMGGQ